MTRSVEPLSRTDPLVGYLSDRAGGPAGRRLRPMPRGRLSMAQVLTALTVVAVLISALASQYCRINGWGGTAVYHWGCYSDVAALWGTRDFDQSAWAPFREDLSTFEYPALTMLLASLTATVTHGVHDLLGGTVLGYWGDRTGLLFWDVSFLLAAGAWVVLVLATMQAAGRRGWDAVLVAVSPAIIFGIGINWDIWPAAALALAVLFWLRGWWVLTGVMIGIGVSFKLYPLFMLGALFTLAARRWLRREAHGLSWWAFLRTLGAASATWSAVNLPVMLVSFDSWARFFLFSAERGAGYSSLWHVWAVLGESGPDAATVSAGSLGLFAAACAGVLAVGLTAPERPRMVQLLFLIVAAFVVCNKVYSPQFMVWLVPLMVLAAPRVRDILIWHAVQLLHFWAVWMHLAGIVGDAEPQHTFDPTLYALAAIGHMLSTAYIAAQVVADIYRPERDVVRSSGPAGRLHAAA
ncbi:hypothetical protein [Nesterenkonia sp.]|uniref:glycosyltransferase family 87 protein n=1 Tax=Nesterenkonia sp. TaxID=704201 RepID=UPI002625DEB4|nr:hypothetical protein [Nesterenkonia sp.]